MKLFLPFLLVLVLGLNGLVSAAPYLVYSGTSKGADFSATGQVNTTTQLYLITDSADTSSFALLQMNAGMSTYSVISRPSDSPAADEADNNFFGGIVGPNQKTGLAALSFTSSTTDSNNNTFVSHGYATGALTMGRTLLVSPRNHATAVVLRSNGVAQGTFTFNAITPAIYSTEAFPKTLTGTSNCYEISAGGPLTHISNGSTFTLQLNGPLTALANIGGAYAVRQSQSAVMPVSVPSGTSVGDAYSAWLSAFAQINGYTVPGSGSSAGSGSGSGVSIGTGSGGFSFSGSLSLLNGGSLINVNGVNTQWALTGTVNNNSGAGAITLGAGTLQTGSSNPVGAILSATGLTWNSGGIIFGGSVPPAQSSGSGSGLNTGGLTFTLNPGSGSTLTLNTTTLPGPNGSLMFIYPGTTTSGQELLLTTTTFTVTGVNGSLINGAIVTSSGITETVTGVSLIVNNVDVSSTVNVGDSFLTTLVSLNGGTGSGTSSAPVYTGGTVTLTTNSP